MAAKIYFGKDSSENKGIMVNQPLKSDGGPSSYYDFLPGWKTWNDFMEAKALAQWGAYSLHMKDIGKALCRFGAKDGTGDEYDMNKIVYSGLRMKEMKQRGSAREYLLRLLDDPQFQ